MIGRLDELNQLERFYNSSKFEFLTMYGRRRIGKTTILREFAGRHKALFFSAQEKNDSLNLLDFSIQDGANIFRRLFYIFFSKLGSCI